MHDLDVHGVLALEAVPQNLLAQGVFNQVFDGAAQRPGPVVRVVALGDQEVLGVVVQDELHAAIGHAGADLRELDVDDTLEVVLVEGVENDDVVDAG